MKGGFRGLCIFRVLGFWMLCVRIIVTVLNNISPLLVSVITIICF